MTTIPANDIVRVNPSVLFAGGQGLDLIGLFLTSSTHVPIGDVHAFANVSDVSDYFGATSDEEKFADIYFKGFDRSDKKPGSILFAQYNGSAVAAYLRGGSLANKSLNTIKGFSGSLTIVIDGYTWTAPSVNLSAATSFSDAAAIIQTALIASPPTAAVVTGSISTTVLTVSAVSSGTVKIGQTVTGSGVTAGTLITGLGTGTGGTGTYTISPSQTAASTTLTMKGTAPTVTYDVVSQAFVVTSGITGVPSTMAFATGTIASNIGLILAKGAVLSQGAAAADPTTFMNALIGITQDWASFVTVFDPDAGSQNDVKLAFATWTNNQNNRYCYVCWDKDPNPIASAPASSSLGQLLAATDPPMSGTCLISASDPTIASFVSGYIASIDFTLTEGRTTAAFRSQAGLVANITDEASANNLIANHYNFYGAYATANQDFVFFYPGSVSGRFAWLDSYTNQIWMNNSFQLSLMNLLVLSRSIPYNVGGYTKIEQTLAPNINDALNFGAIRAGIPLSEDQSSQVNNDAGKKISDTLADRGWVLEITPATASVRIARGTPGMKFWYMDGESVQNIVMDSIDVP